jgi:FMN-dependent NADH-azoreductase
LNSSIFSNGGQSSRLADEFVAAWRTAHPAARIVARDFARDPVPRLTAERFQSFLAKPKDSIIRSGQPTTFFFIRTRAA